MTIIISDKSHKQEFILIEKTKRIRPEHQKIMVRRNFYLSNQADPFKGT